MKYHLCNLIFFLILLFPRLYADDRTNIAVIDSLTRDLIGVILKDTQLSSGDTVALKIELEDRQKVTYCQQILGELLEEKSLTIFRNYNQLSSFDGLVIEISRFGSLVLYTEPYSDGLFGENFTSRVVQVQMSGQVFNAGSGKIYSSNADERYYRDEIRYGVIDEIEASEFGFSRGKRQGYSWWDTYIEPFLVVSSVVVVLLLFFTQRN